MSQPSITNCPFTFGPAVYGWYIRSVYRFHYRLVFTFSHHVCLIQVTIALRFHLFPFRTEKLSSVTPMVLRNSGRVGSRRFLERSPCIGRCRGFLVFGLSFRTEKLSSFVCLALFCLLFFVLLVFLGSIDFQWLSSFLVGIILILVKYLSFFVFRVLYRIVSYPYHIIYLASISSYVFLFLCLKKCSVSYVGRSFIYVSLNRF